MKFNWKRVNWGKCLQIFLLLGFSAVVLWVAKVLLIGGDLPSDSYQVFAVTAVVLVLAAIWFVYLAAERGIWKLERIYLVCGLTLGIIYLFLIPPYATPDEVAHINSAYHVSNVILLTTGENESDGVIAKRVCDKELEFSNEITRKSYNYLLDNMFKGAEDTSMTEESCVVTRPYLVYCVSGIGIALARLLHFGGVATILMGGFFNVLFFVGTMYYAMKKLPFGKIALFAICMMPMTLQQTSSYSYDQMAIAMAFVVTALALRFAYGKEPVKRSELVVYILASVMLVISKGGAYFLLVFLPFVLMFSKEKLTKKNLLCAGGFTAGVALLMLRGKIAALFSGVAPATTAVNAVTEQEGAYIWWADSYAYSLSELLHSPKTFIHIILDTIQVNLDYYMETMIGSHLGWLTIEVATVYLIGFIAVLFLGVLQQEGEPVGIRMRDRFGMWVIGASAIGASMMAMLLYWTPKESATILGVQGRYFIPVLFVLALTLRNKAITIKRNLNRELVLTLLILELAVVISVLQDSVFSF